MLSTRRAAYALCMVVAVCLPHTVVATGACTSSVDCSDIPWGYITLLWQSVQTECDYSSSTITTSKPCQGGYYADSGSGTETICCEGAFCPRGYTCATSCLQGHYCPAGTGSSAPSYCDAGYYCTNPSTRTICPKGSFCPKGSSAPLDCTPMSVCLDEGLSKPVVTLDYLVCLIIIPIVASACCRVCSSGTMRLVRSFRTKRRARREKRLSALSSDDEDEIDRHRRELRYELRRWSVHPDELHRHRRSVAPADFLGGRRPSHANSQSDGGPPTSVSGSFGSPPEQVSSGPPPPALVTTPGKARRQSSTRSIHFEDESPTKASPPSAARKTGFSKWRSPKAGNVESPALPPPLQLAAPVRNLRKSSPPLPDGMLAPPRQGRRRSSFMSQLSEVSAGFGRKQEWPELSSDLQRELDNIKDYINSFGGDGPTIGWDKLVVRRRGRLVLNRLSGQVRKGRLTAIMGPSGAGKTTLLNAICGKVQLSGGFIALDGQKQTHQISDFGYVAQHDVHYPHLTVLETLISFLLLQLGLFNVLKKIFNGFSFTDHAKRLMGVMSLKKVSNTICGPPGAPVISGGEYKRLAIARELLREPKFLIMDEPTTGVDATVSEEIIVLSRFFCTAGKTVVMTIHQPRLEIWELIQDVIILAPCGRVFYQGQRAKLLPYLHLLGFTLPPHANPATFIMDVVSGEVQRDNKYPILPDYLCDIWKFLEPKVVSRPARRIKNLAKALLECELELKIRYEKSDINFADLASGMHHANKVSRMARRKTSFGSMDKVSHLRSVTRAEWSSSVLGDGVRSARRLLPSYCMHFFMLPFNFAFQYFVMLMMFTLMEIRNWKTYLTELGAAVISALAVGIAYSEPAQSDITQMVGLISICIGLLAMSNSIRFYGKEVDIRMRDYVRDYGVMPPAFACAKVTLQFVLMLYLTASFCVFTDLINNLYVMSRFGIYIIDVFLYATVVAGYTGSFFMLFPSLLATLASFVLFALGSFFSGCTPTLVQLELVSPVLRNFADVWYTRWFSHAIFTNRSEFFISSQALFRIEHTQWLSNTYFYSADEDKAMAVLGGVALACLVAPILAWSARVYVKYYVLFVVKSIKAAGFAAFRLVLNTQVLDDGELFRFEDNLEYDSGEDTTVPDDEPEVPQEEEVETGGGIRGWFQRKKKERALAREQKAMTNGREQKAMTNGPESSPALRWWQRKPSQTSVDDKEKQDTKAKKWFWQRNDDSQDGSAPSSKAADGKKSWFSWARRADPMEPEPQPKLVKKKSVSIVEAPVEA